MSLDLKKLSNKLDKALQEETPESLSKWLKEKRKIKTENQNGNKGKS